MDASIIAASAAILGVAVAGIFTVISQWQARTTERLKWEREAREQSRTRFHEDPVNAYADFVASAANAYGSMINLTIEQHGDLPAGAEPVLAGVRLLRLGNDPEIGNDASRQMVLRRTRVILIAGTPEVSKAADALSDAVLQVAMVPRNHPEWNARVFEVVLQYAAAVNSFEVAARAELTS